MGRTGGQNFEIRIRSGGTNLQDGANKDKNVPSGGRLAECLAHYRAQWRRSQPDGTNVQKLSEKNAPRKAAQGWDRPGKKDHPPAEKKLCWHRCVAFSKETGLGTVFKTF